MKISSILISLLLLTAPLKAEVKNIANSDDTQEHIHDENCEHHDETNEFSEFDERSDSSDQKTDINDKNKDSILTTNKAVVGLCITAIGYLIHNRNNPRIINKVAYLGATLAPIVGWFWNTNCGGGGQGVCPHCKIQQALTGK